MLAIINDLTGYGIMHDMSYRKTERELELDIETVAMTLERDGAVLPLVV